MGMGKGRMHESVKTFHTLHQLLEHWYINHSDDETYSHWFELLEKKNTIAKASEEEDRERLNHKTPPLEPNDSLGDGSEAEFIMTSLSSPVNTPPAPPSEFPSSSETALPESSSSSPRTYESTSQPFVVQFSSQLLSSGSRPASRSGSPRPASLSTVNSNYETVCRVGKNYDTWSQPSKNLVVAEAENLLTRLTWEDSATLRACHLEGVRTRRVPQVARGGEKAPKNTRLSRGW